MKAVWNGATLAESNDTIAVAGNHYLLHDSIHGEYLAQSATHTNS